MAEFAATTSLIRPLTPRQVTFSGTGGALFGIYLRNILLSVVTLGVYYFWGKNRTRGYLVNQCEFEGDRFAWHGTGKELLLGALKLAVIAVPVVALLVVVPMFSDAEWVGGVANVVVSAAYGLVVPLAVVGSRRYRMSRLSWRGIRFSFRGRWQDYFKILFRGSFLSAITFGLYYPYLQTLTRKFATEHSYFGNARFSFDGQGRDLFGRFIIVVVAAGAAIGTVVYTLMRTASQWSVMPTGEDIVPFITGLLLSMIGAPLVAGVAAVVAWFWFAAYRQQYYWGHTLFGAARFRSTMTAGKLVVQSVTNLLLLVVTLGLAIPWVMARNARFALSNLILVGSLDLPRLVQEAQAAGTAGESLADALDVDFFGIDLPL